HRRGRLFGAGRQPVRGGTIRRRHLVLRRGTEHRSRTSLGARPPCASAGLRRLASALARGSIIRTHTAARRRAVDAATLPCLPRATRTRRRLAYTTVQKDAGFDA